MQYSLQFKKGGQIHVSTEFNGTVEVIWSKFDWLEKKLAEIDSERVLKEAMNDEKYEAMQSKERLKTFFTRIKDADLQAFEILGEIMKKNDAFIYECIKAI